MKHAAWTRTFLAVVAAAVALWGCANGAPPEPEEPAPAPAPAEPTAEGPPPQDPGQIQAENEDWKRIAQEVAKGRTLQEQQRISESNALHDQALDFYRKGAFEQAKDAAEAAVERWSGNVEARKLLSDINAILVGPANQGMGGLTERVKNEMKVRIEAAQIEITSKIREGDRYLMVNDYEAALKSFEEAEFKIKSIPYEVKAMSQLLPLVEELIRKARDGALFQKKSLEEAQRKMAEAEVAAFEIARKREILEKIANQLELAYMAFDQKRFDQCIKLCDNILGIDAHYAVALELKEDAQKVRHREEYYDFIKAKVENWKQLTNSDDEAIIPYSEMLRFPSREEWAEISKRADAAILKTSEAEAEEDPDILAINRNLDTIKPIMNFENARLEDILAYLRDFTGLNIHIDQALGDKYDPTKTVTFKVKDLPLRNSLILLLRQFDLDFTVTQERIVLITSPDRAGGTPMLELHDIRDILVKITDFPGPRVELLSPSAAGMLSGASFTLDEPKESAVSEEQIVELIQENIAPGTWEGEYTLEQTPNQQLLVNHTPKVQRELRQFLTRLRSYTGTMVSVTARFIASYDDFLNEVGVDIINRPPVGGYDIGGAGFTDIDERATSEVGPGFVTRESARLEVYDLRAQTFHTLIRSDAGAGIVDPMSNRLFNQGGLGLQYQWIGEQALQIVLRAVHKRHKATIVQAPRITVFNTQRSHVMVQVQRAYIADLEPQIALAAAAYDPVLSVLVEGVVLDVRPIVSNDRKYVTLELRPSMAELQQVRTVDISTGLGLIGQIFGVQGGQQNTIQLPWIVLQRTETTVTVPDRGTLVISGFKDIIMRDHRSGVPFLENIPVLNFFFTKKGQTNERRRLQILVTPEIIELGEYEHEKY
ncbi:MAG: hypothetical protein HY716_03155 [Planctomycetes bacterium]|nr:hypothetical protein [Planctomycetota bacterium]